MKKVLKKVLKRVKPSKKEVKKINSVVKKLKKKIKESVKEQGIKAEVVIGGSVSRNTFTKGKHDLDFFVRFMREDSLKKYSRKIMMGLNVAYNTIHGTRDYYNFEFEGYDVELIPTLKIKKPENAENSTDVSYFHINYLKKKYEKTPELRDNIRIFKQFCRGVDVYGSESSKQGISGYVAELLIIHYKSFKKLLEKMEEAKPKIIIDIEKDYKNKNVLKKMNKSKTRGAPIVLVDPVLPERNAAASLSYNTFSKMLYNIRLFIRKPSIKYFNIQHTTIEDIYKKSNKRGTRLFYFELRNSKKYDVFKAKLLKKLKKLIRMLKREGWSIYNYGILDGEKKIYFELETIRMSKSKQHIGPMVWIDSEDFEKFLKKWKYNVLGKPYVKDSHLVVDVFRKQNIKEEIESYLKDFLK